MFSGIRYRRRLQKLIDQWSDFRAMVVTRLGADDVSPSEEGRFLDLKGRIAQGLAELVPHLPRSVIQESQGHQRGMGDLLNHFTTLLADSRIGERLRDDFEREWHRHFLFLNKLKGIKAQPETKEVRPTRPSAVSPANLPPRRDPGNWALRLILRLAFVVAVIWALVRFVPWHRIGSDSPRGANAGTIGEFFSGIWASVRSAAGGLRLPSLGSVFDPVVQQYGPEVTTVMVAVLLITFGYWIFVRMK